MLDTTIDTEKSHCMITVYNFYIMFAFVRLWGPLRVQKRLNPWKCHKNQFWYETNLGHLSPVFMKFLWFYWIEHLFFYDSDLLIGKFLRFCASDFVIMHELTRTEGQGGNNNDGSQELTYFLFNYFTYPVFASTPLIKICKLQWILSKSLW